MIQKIVDNIIANVLILFERYLKDTWCPTVKPMLNVTFSGGSVPVFDEIIISTSLMNKIIDVDETAGE